MCDFPEYFASMHSHMMLIPESDTLYHLMPPNQMDWQFKLTKVGDNKWEVFAVKDYDYNLQSPWEYTEYYKWSPKDNHWNLTKK